MSNVDFYRLRDKLTGDWQDFKAERFELIVVPLRETARLLHPVCPRVHGRIGDQPCRRDPCECTAAE